jgi:hypothetical protein
MNSLVAQNEEVASAKLFITYQKSDNSNQKSNIYLKGEEAYQFDVADFLAKNKNENLSINGGATVNNEKISWKYNSADVEESADKFSQVVTSIEKIPFLGVSVKATEDFSGAEVTQIIEGTSAEAYGLEVGDVITLINNSEISTTCDLTIAINQSEIGDILDIDFVRANENVTLEPVLGYRLHKKLSWEPNTEGTTIALENTTANVQNADLSVYPNPTGGIVQFKYSTTQKGDVQMNLTDIMGRVVMTKKIEKFSGLHEEMLDLKGMQDGVYFLNIVQGEEVRTEKIVLQKG